MKLEFSRYIFENTSDTKFHQNPSNGSRVIPCGQREGRTDGRRDMKLVVAFRSFTNAPNNQVICFLVNNRNMSWVFLSSHRDIVYVGRICSARLTCGLIVADPYFVKTPSNYCFCMLTEGRGWRNNRKCWCSSNTFKYSYCCHAASSRDLRSTL